MDQRAKNQRNDRRSDDDPGDVLGTAAALALIRARFPGSAADQRGNHGAVIVPVIIAACGIFAVFRLWGLIGTVTGRILAHTALAIPFVVVTVSASVRTVDRRLEEAAAGSAPRRCVAFRRITLPRHFPRRTLRALFAFVASLDEVVVSLFVSTAQVRPLAVQMWSDVRGASTRRLLRFDASVRRSTGVLLFVSLCAVRRDRAGVKERNLRREAPATASPRRPRDRATCRSEPAQDLRRRGRGRYVSLTVFARASS